MLWGLGRPPAARPCARSTQKVWCLQATAQPQRVGAQPVHAVSLAAPSLAPQGLPNGRALLPNDNELNDRHAPARAPNDGSTLALLPELVADAALLPASLAAAVSVRDKLVISHGRDHSENCSSTSRIVNDGGIHLGGNSSSSALPHAAVASLGDAVAFHSAVSQQQQRDGGGPSTSGRIDEEFSTSDRSRSRSSSNRGSKSKRRGSAAASGGTAQAAPSQPSMSSTDPSPGRSPGISASTLSLEQLRLSKEVLAGTSPAVLQVRLTALVALLKLEGAAAALRLCAAVPGLLLMGPTQMEASWDRLRHAVGGGDDQVRRAIVEAPLLLVLPGGRVAECVAALVAATGLPRCRARALLREVPTLGTLAPATLVAKLAGLQRLLGGGSGVDGSGGGPAAATAAPAAAQVIAAASSSALAVPVAAAAPSAPAGGPAADAKRTAGKRRAAASGSHGKGKASSTDSTNTASTDSSSASATSSTSTSAEGTAGTSGSVTRSTKPPSRLAEALRQAPRLLTFSTATLQSHHDYLAALLGPDRLAAALREEPGLLGLGTDGLTTKLRLLQELLGCTQQPAAVALLVARSPGLLFRSLTALSCGCRALSIWRLSPRCKLRMVLSRPRLLRMPAQELHGRCRWLRRLMLSNGYYHAALRRLPPGVLAAVIVALPAAWPRLQFLADSSQEGALALMEAVECEQAAFEGRFPQFRKWYEFKLKQMGADNPWRGTMRVRGIGTEAGAAGKGAPNQRNIQAQQGSNAFRKQGGGRGPEPTVAVVMTEAGEVRSGGATVSRPRRIVQRLVLEEQPAAAGAASAPDASSTQALTDASSTGAVVGVGSPALATNGAGPGLLAEVATAAPAAATDGSSGRRRGGRPHGRQPATTMG